MTGWFLEGVCFYLDFVAAAQIDPTIGIRPAIEFDMQLEIFKLGIMDQDLASFRFQPSKPSCPVLSFSNQPDLFR